MKRNIGLALTAIVLLCLAILGLIASSPLWIMDSKQTPTVSPAVTPTFTAAINPSSVGICVHTLTEEDAKLVAESGAKWVRIDISNNETATTNSLINAKNHDLSVLGILDSWMFDQSCAFTLDEWANAVSFNLTKYAPYVDAWEIWNEPTSTNPGWQLQADYLSMVQIASPIIRQIDPTAKIVLLGGLQLYTGGNKTVLQGDIAFAGNLSSYNLMQYGDAISVHAYPWGIDVSASVWNSYKNSLDAYRNKLGNSSLDIWVTETGYNLTGSTESAQAQYLHDSLDFFNGSVSHVFWYALHDENATGAGDFGLVDADMQPREAYTALQDSLR
jgi:hypothetical protein